MDLVKRDAPKVQFKERPVDLGDLVSKGALVGLTVLLGTLAKNSVSENYQGPNVEGRVSNAVIRYFAPVYIPRTYK